MFKISPFQDLFIQQEISHGTSANNVLSGEAIFKNVDFEKLCQSIEKLLQQSDWAHLNINLEKKEWELSNELNGKFQINQEEPTEISVFSHLWSIRVTNNNKEVRLTIDMHHALGDAHSFQLFWNGVIGIYNNTPLPSSPIQTKDFIQEDKREITGAIKAFANEGLGPVKRHTISIPSARKMDAESAAKMQQLNLSTLFLGALQHVLDETEPSLDITFQTGMALRNRTGKYAKESFLTSVNFLPITHHGTHELKQLENAIKNHFRNQSYALLDWLKNENRTNAFNVLFSYQKENYIQNEQLFEANLTFLPPTIDETILSMHVLDFGTNELKISFDYRTDIATSIFWRKLIFNVLITINNLLKNHPNFVEYTAASIAPLNVGRIDFWKKFDGAADDQTALIVNNQKYTFREIKHQLSQLPLIQEEIVQIQPNRTFESILQLLHAWKQNKTICFLPLTEPIEPIKDSLYLVETSGSTGIPKKILITKEGIESLLYSWTEKLAITSSSVHLSIADQRFDVFFGDVFRSILSGNTLVLATEEERLSALQLKELITKHSVTHFETTPSLIELFIPYLKECTSLKYVICGSEPITKELYATLIEQTPSTLQLINSYGLTEVSIDSALAPLNSYDGDYFPVGFPLGDQTFCIYSSTKKIMPIGTWGELGISGACVGMPSPRITDDYQKMNGGTSYTYFTGDKAMIHPTFGLIIKGRIKDDFIKIHGKRIPAKEIENLLFNTTNATKIKIFEQTGNAILIHNSTASPEQINEIIGKKFSRYQWPDKIIFIEHWPVNKNGKIDVEQIKQKLESFKIDVEQWVPTQENGELMLYEALLKTKKSFGGKEEKLSSFGWNSIDLLSFCNELSLLGYPVSIPKFITNPTIFELISQKKQLDLTTESAPSNEELHLDDDDLDDLLNILNNE